MIGRSDYLMNHILMKIVELTPKLYWLHRLATHPWGWEASRICCPTAQSRISPGSSFRVPGFRVQGSRFKIQGLGFRFQVCGL